MPDRQFYGAIIWYHLMAPFYGMCVPGIKERLVICIDEDTDGQARVTLSPPITPSAFHSRLKIYLFHESFLP